MQKSTLKIAEQLLDRFFRDAEGRTNRQVDVYFALEDMEVPRDKAAPALEYLQSRGLLNLFGNDIAFLTDKGVAAVVEEQDIANLPKEVRDFAQKAVPSASPAPQPAPRPAAPTPGQGRGSPRPKRAQLTHIDLEGKEFTLPLGWRCGIGRADDNEVRINDQRASKHHAEIIYEDAAYYLVDLESANGTLLNGDYALEKTRLKHDDEVVIGRTMLLFQAPEVIHEPPPLTAEEPVDEPGTVLTTRPPAGPTERPAPAEEPSIRVVKGRPDTPPMPTPAPRVTNPTPLPMPAPSGPDLFAEPPTRGPSRDLFAEPAVSDADLFAPAPSGAHASVSPLDPRSSVTPRAPSLDFEEPPTHVPGGLFDDDARGADAGPGGGDDLFGDVEVSDGEDLFGEADTPERARDGLFEPDDGQVVAEGLFDDEPVQGGDDLFSEGSGPQVVPAEPLDPADTLAEPSLDEVPADDLWSGDVTPTSDPGPLENVPVQHAGDDGTATVDTGPQDDGATLMLDRDDLMAPEEHPSWAATGPGRGSHPGFGPGDTMDAATEALEAEALPVASPSLAINAVTADTARTLEAAPNREFNRTLAALREHLRTASVQDRDALLLAVDLLEHHPYIRTLLKTLP